jgi:hypothetical protein
VGAAEEVKVFWFFSSEKNALLIYRGRAVSICVNVDEGSIALPFPSERSWIGCAQQPAPPILGGFFNHGRTRRRGL